MQLRPKLNTIKKIVFFLFNFISRLKMFRVLANKWPPVLKSSPVLPLATTPWCEDHASEDVDEDLAPPCSGQAGAGGDQEV